LSKWHGGKGSSRRKGSDDEKFKSNWDKIFGKKEEVVHDKCGTDECCGTCETATEKPEKEVEFYQPSPRIP